MPVANIGGCCCEEEVDCDDLPETLYIWFDMGRSTFWFPNPDGTYENGPHAMTYDAGLDAWLHELTVTYPATSGGFNIVLADSACSGTQNGGDGTFFYALKRGASPASRILQVSYYACRFSSPSEFEFIRDQHTADGWVASAAGSPMTVSPVLNDGASVAQGYLMSTVNATDSCEDVVFQDPTYQGGNPPGVPAWWRCRIKRTAT